MRIPVIRGVIDRRLLVDCALLMRGIEHEWHARGCLDCEAAVRVPAC
jgi:hypothetical protein